MKQLASWLLCAFALSACGGHSSVPSVLAPRAAHRNSAAGPNLFVSVKQPLAFQVFDDTQNGYITTSSAKADAYRYIGIWRAAVSSYFNPANWLTNNPNNLVGWYMVQPADAGYDTFGSIGHDLSGWQSVSNGGTASKPDKSWVEYECNDSDNSIAKDSSGNPIPAYVGGQRSDGSGSIHAVPLDIRNTNVASYVAGEMKSAMSLG